MSVNFSSCKDDDEDDKIENCDYIVGTWSLDEWTSIDIITFKENGKGDMKITERGYDPYTFKFTYKMLSKTEGYLTYYAIEEDGKVRDMESKETSNFKIEDGALLLWNDNINHASKYTRRE